MNPRGKGTRSRNFKEGSPRLIRNTLLEDIILKKLEKVKIIFYQIGLLVSGDNFGHIKVWDTSTGDLKRTIKGHSDVVRTIVVLPNGQLASGSKDRTIKFWKLI